MCVSRLPHGHMNFAAVRKATDHNSPMEGMPMLDRRTNLNKKVSSG